MFPAPVVSYIFSRVNHGLFTLLRTEYFCGCFSFSFTPELYHSINRLLGEGMKHDAALRALMGESKAQQKQRLQERLEQLRKLKQEGGKVDEGQMAALEQVEAEGVDAVDTEVLNQLIEETITDTEEVTTSTLLNDLSVRLTFSFPPSAFISSTFPPPPPPTTHRPHTFSTSLPFVPALFLFPFSLSLSLFPVSF